MLTRIWHAATEPWRSRWLQNPDRRRAFARRPAYRAHQKFAPTVRT